MPNAENPNFSCCCSVCPFLNFGFLKLEGFDWILHSRGFVKGILTLANKSFKCRILLKGFSRGADASAVTSYTNPGRNPLGTGPPSANPRWNSSHRLLGCARLGSTLSSTTTGRPLVSISYGTFLEFCLKFRSKLSFFSTSEEKKFWNFEFCSHRTVWERDVTEQLLLIFSIFFVFNLIAEPHRFPNQSRRLPFAARPVWQLVMSEFVFVFHNFQKHHYFPLHLSICSSSFSPVWEYKNKRIKYMH